MGVACGAEGKGRYGKGRGRGVSDRYRKGRDIWRSGTDLWESGPIPAVRWGGRGERAGMGVAFLLDAEVPMWEGK